MTRPSRSGGDGCGRASSATVSPSSLVRRDRVAPRDGPLGVPVVPYCGVCQVRHKLSHPGAMLCATERTDEGNDGQSRGSSAGRRYCFDRGAADVGP
jgi:hypothetical protein